MHILRLVGKIKDIQKNPSFKGDTWSALFVNFISAFDCVDHILLFQKLQKLKVSGRKINILKLLYNSYHFSLLGDKP